MDYLLISGVSELPIYGSSKDKILETIWELNLSTNLTLLLNIFSLKKNLKAILSLYALFFAYFTNFSLL
jgi:hypothetical protein